MSHKLFGFLKLWFYCLSRQKVIIWAKLGFWRQYLYIFMNFIVATFVKLMNNSMTSICYAHKTCLLRFLLALNIFKLAFHRRFSKSNIIFKSSLLENLWSRLILLNHKRTKWLNHLSSFPFQYLIPY